MKQILMAVMVLVTGALFTGCIGSKKLLAENQKLKQKVDSLQRLANAEICTTNFRDESIGDFMDVVARYRDTHWDLINKDMKQRKEEAEEARADSREPSRSYANNVFGSSASDGLNNGKGMSYVDGRAVWFSLDQLKSFFCFIEKHANSIGIHDSLLGIRFYYAVYPKEYQTFGKRGQHTLFMVPTVGYEDFEPVLSALESKKAKGTTKIAFLKPYLKSNSSMQITALTDRPTYVWNNGQICPTQCPTRNNSLDIIETEMPPIVDY